MKFLVIGIYWCHHNWRIRYRFTCISIHHLMFVTRHMCLFHGLFRTPSLQSTGLQCRSIWWSQEMRKELWCVIGTAVMTPRASSLNLETSSACPALHMRKTSLQWGKSSLYYHHWDFNRRKSKRCFRDGFQTKLKESSCPFQSFIY